MSATCAIRWPTGGTPPIAKPVASRTKSASARAMGSPTSAEICFCRPGERPTRPPAPDARSRREIRAISRSAQPCSRSPSQRPPRCACRRRTRAPRTGSREGLEFQSGRTGRGLERNLLRRAGRQILGLGRVRGHTSSRARMQSFQAVAAPLPGDRRRLGELGAPRIVFAPEAVRRDDANVRDAPGAGSCGSGLPSPCRFRAQTQPFQGVPAPFPGDSALPSRAPQRARSNGFGPRGQRPALAARPSTDACARRQRKWLRRNPTLGLLVSGRRLRTNIERWRNLVKKLVFF